MLEEVISDNQLTTVMQNDERSRSGKFSLPIFADKMVKHLV